MILFYSKHCNHSSMLISNISRYDKDKRIKLVCIDDLLSENIGIEKKIQTVPAFMILPSKELLYGKAVFDHLLLPGRGLLCSEQSTRIEKPASSTTSSDNNLIQPLNNELSDGSPSAFALNGFNFSDNFSAINEGDTSECNDKNYNWDYITNDRNLSDQISDIKYPEAESNKNMPTLEELQKARDELKFE
jgi:hypothetical protein